MRDAETFETQDRPKTLFGREKYFPTEQRNLFSAGNDLIEAITQYDPNMIPLSKKIAPCAEWWTYLTGQKNRINNIKRDLGKAKDKLTDIGV